MNIKGVIGTFLAAVICSAGFTGYAGVIGVPVEKLAADVDYNASEVIVSGDTGAVSGVYRMAYTVTDKNGDVVFMDESRTLDKNGGFKFLFHADTNAAQDAVYTLNIGGHYATEVPLAITVYGTSTRNAALGELKNLSGTAFAEKLAECAPYFSIDLTDADNAGIADDVIAVLESKKSSLTASNARQIARETIIYNIFKKADEKITTEILEDYNDILGINISDDSYYARIEDKSGIYEFVSEKANNVGEIKAYFDEAVMIESFGKLDREEMDGLLKEYAANINSEYMSVYNGFDTYKKAEVWVALEKADFDSLADIKKVFEDAVIANKKTNSGGGGGNGGGGKGGYSAPVSVAPVGTVAVPLTKFADIGGYPWAVEGITYLSDKGIVNGVSESSFNPGGIVTRAQLIKMLVNAYSVPSAKEKYSFGDVSENDWAYDYICRAYENGLVNGYGDGKIGANDPVSRQDMAVMAYRFATKFGSKSFVANTDETFADDTAIAGYAKDAVYAMKNSGVINGVGENKFDASGSCSRAMAAKVVYELIK